MISSVRSQSAETQWPLSGRLVQKRALTGGGAQPVQIQVSHLISKQNKYLLSHLMINEYIYIYCYDYHYDDEDDEFRSATRSSDLPQLILQPQ